MNKKSAAAVRPISPHLSVYKLIPTMLMSILHRMTGVALYAGTLLLAWWLISAASSREAFDLANAVFGSWFGQLILFGFTLALMHHMAGGIRHLFWDTGSGLDPKTSTRMALITPAISVALTILIWLAGYALH